MDDDLINLTRDAATLRSKKKEKEKRGRGRPRKILPVSASASSEEPPAPEFNYYGAPEVVFPDAQAAQQPDDEDERIELISMIVELRDKLGAQGSKITMLQNCTTQKLRDEFNLMNRQINSKRAETMVQHLCLEMIIPAIEKLAPYVIPQSQLDVTGMSKEARDDYDEVFKDTLTHISILNRRFFSLGPYGEFINGVVTVAKKAAMKNHLRRQIAEREAALAAAGDDPDEDVEDKQPTDQ